MSGSARDRRGIPASPGIAIGPAYVLRRERLIIPEHHIEPDQIEAEVERLHAAFRTTRAKLDEIREGMQSTGLVGSIFDAQFLFLEDPTLLEQATANIREQQLNAEWALQRELRRLEAMLVVADAEQTLLLSGTGDLIEPDDGVLSVGSGSVAAMAAARTLVAHTDFDARKIATEALGIAASLDIYTNDALTVEEI